MPAFELLHDGEETSNLKIAFDITCSKFYMRPVAFRMWLYAVQTAVSSEFASWHLFFPDHRHLQ